MDAWIDQLAEALGEDTLSETETSRLLSTARDVAHRVERRITPVSTFLLGAAVGRSLAGGASRADALQAALDTVDSLLPEAAAEDTSPLIPPRQVRLTEPMTPRTPTSPAPTVGPLVDTFDRVADDLRLSVTDRCNFRCTYCMPAEGLKWLPKEEILTFEELARLVRLFVGLGVRSIKITGGEPTVRADLPTLVRMLRDVGPDLDISMTTNGVLLDRLAEPPRRGGPRPRHGVLRLAHAPPLRGDDPPRRA